MKKYNLNLISKYRGELFGISIILIILHHFFEDYYKFAEDVAFNIPAFKRYTFVPLHTYMGSIGVEIFVFLSGMGLYYSFSKNRNLKRFYARRYERILVPYIITAVPFFLIKDLHYMNSPFSQVVKDLCFLDKTTLWYIQLMVIVYLLFPLIYKSIYDAKTPVPGFVFWSAAGIAASFITYYAFGGTEARRILGKTVDRIFCFVLGCAFGKMIKEGKKVNTPVTILYIIAAFAFDIAAIKLHMGDAWEKLSDTFLGIALIIIFTAIINLIKKARALLRFLRFAGSYSLELFLCHVIVRNLAKEAGFHTYRIGVYCMVIFISCILSGGVKKMSDYIIARLNSKKVTKAETAN